MGLATNLNRQLFGYDFFVSYSRKDTSEYASNLANKIIERGHSCFLDQWGSEPGKALPNRLKSKIRNSSVLILLGSDEALNSDAVEQEIDLFLPTKRVIIPVNFGNIYDSVWFPKIEGIAISNEPQELIDKNEPSNELQERIIKAFTYTKQSKRVRNSGLAAIGLIGVSILISLWVSKSLNNKIDEGNKRIAQANIEIQENNKELKENSDKISKSEKEIKQKESDLQIVDEKLKIQLGELKILEKQFIEARAAAIEFEEQSKRNLEMTIETSHNAMNLYLLIQDYVQTSETDKLQFYHEDGKQDPSALSRIYYRFDRSNISENASKVLDELVQFLSVNPDLKVRIEANMGRQWVGPIQQEFSPEPEELKAGGLRYAYSDPYALALSDRRAKSAKFYLIDKGIDTNRIIALGYGNYQKEVQNEDSVNLADIIGDYATIFFID